MLNTQEHIDLVAMFEREYSGRLDKENRTLWPRGHVYQDAQLNELFIAYRRGYAFGKCVCRDGEPNSKSER